jgi:hypothetical protein
LGHSGFVRLAVAAEMRLPMEIRKAIVLGWRRPRGAKVAVSRRFRRTLRARLRRHQAGVSAWWFDESEREQQRFANLLHRRRRD